MFAICGENFDDREKHPAHREHWKYRSGIWGLEELDHLHRTAKPHCGLSVLEAFGCPYSKAMET